MEMPTQHFLGFNQKVNKSVPKLESLDFEKKNKATVICHDFYLSSCLDYISCGVSFVATLTTGSVCVLYTEH